MVYLLAGLNELDEGLCNYPAVQLLESLESFLIVFPHPRLITDPNSCSANWRAQRRHIIVHICGHCPINDSLVAKAFRTPFLSLVLVELPVTWDELCWLSEAWLIPNCGV